MSFTFTNAISPELAKNPLSNLVGNILSGYTGVTNARYLKPTLEEQLKKARLYNQYYGPNIESEIGLRGAQAGHLGSLTAGQNIANRFAPGRLQSEQQEREFKLNNPFFGQTGISGDVGRMLYLKQMLQNNPDLLQGMGGMGGLGGQQGQSNQMPQQAPNGGEGQSYLPPIMQQTNEPMHNQPSPMDMINQAISNSLNPLTKSKQYAPSSVSKLQSELRDIEHGFIPNTNRTQKIENEQDKEDLAAPYREKLGGLKGDEHYIYDPETHEKIGTQRPFTPKERETETGRSFFNEVFPAVNNGFKDFIGKDSVKNFVKYANEYGKDENATRKIDDLLLAQKLITAGVVNEAATLGAGKTNMTYKNLAKSFPGSDIPNLIERYGKELKLPGEAFLKAGIRFQNAINRASEKSSSNVPAMKTLYYHPEKHYKTDEQVNKALEEHEETVTIRNKKTGDKETVSKAEARKRGIKNV